MRHTAGIVLGLVALSSALQIPNLQPFFNALPPSLLDYLPIPIDNATDHALLKRQAASTCPSNWNNCGGIGASAVCCYPNAVCSADFAGHVACCPSGVACTGTVGGVITAGTVDQSGNVAGAAGAATTIAASTTALQGATTTTTAPRSTNALTTPTATTGGGGFIIVQSNTVATPGFAIRGAQIPLAARAILRILELLPI